MYRQVGNLILNEEGIAQRGLLIRHLILPNGWAGTKEVMAFISQEVSRQTYISLMAQYFPAYKAAQFSQINRKVSPQEYEEAKRVLLEAGISRGWFQDI